jgi:hypothetical protein
MSPRSTRKRAQSSKLRDPNNAYNEVESAGPTKKAKRPLTDHYTVARAKATQGKQSAAAKKASVPPATGNTNPEAASTGASTAPSKKKQKADARKAKEAHSAGTSLF